MMWGAKDEQYPLLALSLLYEQTHNIHAKTKRKKKKFKKQETRNEIGKTNQKYIKGEKNVKMLNMI